MTFLTDIPRGQALTSICNNIPRAGEEQSGSGPVLLFPAWEITVVPLMFRPPPWSNGILLVLWGGREAKERCHIHSSGQWAGTPSSELLLPLPPPASAGVTGALRKLGASPLGCCTGSRPVPPPQGPGRSRGDCLLNEKVTGWLEKHLSRSQKLPSPVPGMTRTC